ncbi:hypothetical protein PsorP6_014206 [Peronosclerospora sorghi]|uniref:Uncharacterized protein n=1 Tax=Peronosclerospora sorghi TaxID=230839 RepID=A0ACC0VIF9_9STRA|nr:hypothetical protein PsorP6_014206 [Peronosclerospora sorghi]
MTPKLEYLQRYLSVSGGEPAEKKRVKKVKKATKAKPAALTTCVVDADDTWEDSAPSKEEIEKKWEMDAAEEEMPVLVAVDGSELVEEDLPVYVDSDTYLQFQGRNTRGKAAQDDDLSPPRKKDEAVGEEDTEKLVSSWRREDPSPSRRGADEANATSTGQKRDSDECSKKKEVSLRRRSGREQCRESDEQSGDASPPRRRARRDGATDSSGGTKSMPTSTRQSQGVEEQVESRVERDTIRGQKDDDVSPPRRSRHMKSRSSPRHGQSQSRSPALSARQHRKVEDASSARRSRHVNDSFKPASELPTASDRHRRVDSLGRDIPPCSSSNETRTLSSEEDSRPYQRNDGSKSERRRKRRNRSRSRSRCRSLSRNRSRRAHESTPRRKRRQSRSRSPRTQRRASRSSSARRRRSPKRSRERGSEPRKRSRDRRSASARSRRTVKREQASPRRKHSSDRIYAARDSASSCRRSCSRSNSPEHGSPPSENDDGWVGGHKTRPDAHSEVTAEKSRDSKRASRESAGTPNGKDSVLQEQEEKRAGLFTAAEFDRQRKLVAKQQDVLRTVPASALGAHAETVYRDKRGRKLDMLNELVRQQEVLAGKRQREEREEYEWGTGHVQKRARQSQHDLLEQMKTTPFARYDDDEALERERRARVRAFDPMHSTFFHNYRVDEGKSKGKSKKHEKKRTRKPTYAGPPAPPNRFGIVPGYRWDGVVRGINWEEKILMRQNGNAAANEEAYKYAVADM